MTNFNSIPTLIAITGKRRDVEKHIGWSLLESNPCDYIAVLIVEDNDDSYVWSFYDYDSPVSMSLLKQLALDAKRDYESDGDVIHIDKSRSGRYTKDERDEWEPAYYIREEQEEFDNMTEQELDEFFNSELPF